VFSVQLPDKAINLLAFGVVVHAYEVQALLVGHQVEFVMAA